MDTEPPEELTSSQRLLAKARKNLAAQGVVVPQQQSPLHTNQQASTDLDDDSEPVIGLEDYVPENNRPYSTDSVERQLRGLSIEAVFDRYWSSNKKAERNQKWIKVQCPMPDHPDNNPSAQLFTHNNTWYCHRCAPRNRYLDVFDLAAIAHGLDPKSQFPEVKRRMATDFGVRQPDRIVIASEGEGDPHLAIMTGNSGSRFPWRERG
jgi:hypothetical protein